MMYQYFQSHNLWLQISGKINIHKNVDGFTNVYANGMQQEFL